METPRPTNRLPWILLALVLLAGGVYVFRDRIGHVLLSSPTSTSDPVVQTLTGPGVLRRIQEQSKLSTVSFKIETVVTAEKDGTWWKAWQDKQTAILLADGTVSAGIDLGKLRPNDVQVSSDGKSVHITLPPAEIIDTNLERTRTYDYRTGVFGLINLDQKLMEQAQQDARPKIHDTACASDILSIATQNGQRQVENLFSMMNVSVTVMPAPIPACAALAEL